MLEKLKDIFTSVLSFTVVILCMVGYPYGIHHAFTKHSTSAGALSIIIPPTPLYFAVESVFWHDDYRDVDWDKRLQEDRELTWRILVTGAEMDNDPLKYMEFKEALAKVSSRFASYPQEKQSELKAFALDFMHFTTTFENVLIDGMASSLKNGEGLSLAPTPELVTLEKNMIKKYPGFEKSIEDSHHLLSLLEKQMSSEHIKEKVLNDIPSALLLVEGFKLNLDTRRNKMKETMADLFDVQ